VNGVLGELLQPTGGDQVAREAVARNAVSRSVVEDFDIFDMSI